MNWRGRLVSPKDEATDARSLAFGIEWPARSGTDPTYCVGARSPRWVNHVLVGRPVLADTVEKLRI